MYSSPRVMRLDEDYKKMQELVKRSNFITFKASGNPFDRYVITYTCKGLKLDGVSKQVIPVNFHQVEIYLPTTYPRVKPNLEWLTPIYHPNIGTNNSVCIGGWSPSESLDMFCVRLGEMIQYKNFDEYDPLNESAAKWTLKNRHSLPIDNRPLDSKETSELIGGIELKFS